MKTETIKYLGKLEADLRARLPENFESKIKEANENYKANDSQENLDTLSKLISTICNEFFNTIDELVGAGDNAIISKPYTQDLSLEATIIYDILCGEAVLAEQIKEEIYHKQKYGD